jgi:hypothetical protein
VKTLKPFTLTFVGEQHVAGYTLPRYQRHHGSLAAAQKAARQVATEMGAHGIPAGAHAAVIYGPRGAVYGA